MYYYNYDEKTGEYLSSAIADLDPMATKREGKEVYLLPAYATLKKPPSLNKYKVAIFQNNTWVIKDDYRGAYICDENLGVLVVQEIGPIPEGYILITEAEAAQIANEPLWYIIQDGELVKNPNYEEQKEEQRRQYLSMLAMTKYDFYKCICVPNGIAYTQLLAIVNSNEEIAAAWNLCGHVYRGDKTLCKYIQNFFPEMTEQVLDNIFKTYGKIINE